jgi:hypothetical protein
MGLVSFAAEDTTNNGADNDDDGNWYGELDPVVRPFLDRCGGYETGGLIVVRISRSVRGRGA